MAQSNCGVSLIIKEKAENAFWLWRSNEVALPLSLELTFFIKDKISTLKLSNVMAIGLCTIFDSTYFALLTIIMCCCQFFYYFFVLFTFTKGQTKSNHFFIWTFPPKNKQTISTLLLWNLRLTCFCSFFGGNWRQQKDILKLTVL